MFRTDEASSGDDGNRFIAFLKRHRTSIGYVYVTLLFVVALVVIQVNSDDARARERHTNAENVYRDCLSRQSGRQTLRDVIIVATSRTTNGLDLTSVPGFSDLDPATQQFFRNITPVSKAPPPTTTPANPIPDPDPSNALQTLMLSRAPSIQCDREKEAAGA